MGDFDPREDKDAAVASNCEVKFGSLKLGTRKCRSVLSCYKSRRKESRPQRRKLGPPRHHKPAPQHRSSCRSPRRKMPRAFRSQWPIGKQKCRAHKGTRDLEDKVPNPRLKLQGKDRRNRDPPEEAKGHGTGIPQVERCQWADLCTVGWVGAVEWVTRECYCEVGVDYTAFEDWEYGIKITIRSHP